MQILDGKAAAKALSENMKAKVADLVSKGQRPPHLVAILVGHDGASETYVGAKEKKCQELGFTSTILRFEEDITQEALLAEIERINNDPTIDGLIVQLPLPRHINEQLVTQAVAPEKDVDGFHPTNLGRLLLGQECYEPATPAGIIELLRFHNIDTKGKHAVVLGRSHIVGLPMANLLIQKRIPGNCTVTICHSQSQGREDILRTADILVIAVGKPEFLKGRMVKEGAVVIDVGIHRIEAANTRRGWALKGDVDYDEVSPKCSWITPVPGGVGPMTIVTLMTNTLKARLRQLK